MSSIVITRHIAVLGAGSWGTALAILLARNGLQVRLWGHESQHMERLERARENKEFLPGFVLPASVVITDELKAALSDVSEVLIVVPSHAFATVLRTSESLMSTHTGISWATKGFNPSDNRLLHHIAAEILGNNRKTAVISGPTFAKEVAAGLPTAVTVASVDHDYAKQVSSYLHSKRLRAYTSDDIVGVQVGGAAKNVLAIAAGIADGLGFGANTRAALITRGLVELTRLGLALGGKANTFNGLAGLGDLALTCTDNQSRNRRFGVLLAQGITTNQACQQIGQEVEGVITAKSVFNQSQQLGLEMPICEQVYKIIYEHIAPLQAVETLLDRVAKTELN
ncbi:glycerol-3-phosphate dehydrogenase [Achromatium sp. WMS2]|nr:glycerol-3-phosphate dehydrogenase [Achromatium sp. WMS2]